MSRIYLPVIWIVLLAGCAPHRGAEAIPSPDALTRATPGTSAQVLEAARDVLTQLSLPVEPEGARPGRVISYPMLVQESWHPGPVSDRLLCGVPLSREGVPSPRSARPGYDLGRATDLTQRVPVRVRVGFDVADRLGGTSTRLVVQAAGLRESIWGDFDEEIACVPTQAFVDQVFDMLTGQTTP